MHQLTHQHAETRPPALRGTAARRGGWRFALLVVSAVLLPTVILVAASLGAWRSVSAEADRELEVAAEAAAEFALRVIEGHGRLASRIAESLAGEEDADIVAAAPALRERFGRFVADLPLASAVVVAGGDGRPLIHAPAPGEPAEPMPDVAAAELAAIEQGLLASRAFLPAPGAAPAFAVAQARQGGAGFVAIVLDANAIGAGIARVLGGTGDTAALVRADGHILARQPPFDTPPPRLGAERPLIAALAAGGRQGRLDGQTPRDGLSVLIRYRRVEGHAPLAVAVARPWREVAARWRRVTGPLQMIGIPAILALAALAWLARGKQRALEAALSGLEQRVAERTASLLEGEERLRLAIGAGRFGTWETDLRSGITTRSDRAIEIMGLPPADLASTVENWGGRIHPADRARVLDAWDRAVSGRTPGYREEYRFQRPDGAWRWLESTAAVVRTDPASGAPLRLAGTVRDITERKEAEERRELLTQEVNHRARNTLAIVQAILRLTRAEDSASYARLVEGRIAALARAQSLLAAERWTGAPLHAVLAEELAPFGTTAPAEGGTRGTFLLDGPPLRLRAEAVQPLGIVFHELATNAAKHGALSTPRGRVEVSWRVDEPAGLVRLTWRETGGPVPGLPKHRGVGSRVIEATIMGQLGGRIDRRWPAEGLVCDIAVPVARMRAGPA